MSTIRNFICQFSARIPIPAKCGIISMYMYIQFIFEHCNLSFNKRVTFF